MALSFSSKRFSIKSRREGFTLLECVISLIIVLIAGLGTIGGIVYTRQTMELEKQRLSAMNWVRMKLEVAAAQSSINYAGDWTLDPVFNSPGNNVNATLHVEYFPVNSDGTVSWGSPVVVPPNDGQPVYCRVSCTWNPPGSWGRRQQMVRMGTIVRDDYRNGGV
jgi:prepilin-type N-terminal cleavage/methylation domain-containing protein